MRNTKKGLSATTLFLIAFVLLVINHFCIVYDDVIGLNSTINEIQWFITRPYCVIFYFLVAESMTKTKDRKKFMLILLVLAFIFDLAYDKVFNHIYFDFTDQNDFFDFFMGALTIFAYDKFEGNKPLQILSVVVLCAISWITNLSGNVIAILATLIFYVLRNDKNRLYIAAIAIVVSSFALYAVWVLQERVVQDKLVYFAIQQAFGVFALPMIAKYNGEIGNLPKWVYYIFYPANIIIVKLIVDLIAKI